MSDDRDYRECDKLFEQIEQTINYGAHDDPADVALKFVRACYHLLQPENVDYAFKELEQRLQYFANLMRGFSKQHAEVVEVPIALLDKSTDAIRQQAERISTLQAKIYLVGMDRDKQAERIAELERADDITMTGFNKAIDERNELQSQLTAAQQRLEQWEGQQVILYMCHETANTGNTGREGDIALIARLPDDEGEKHGD